MTVIVFCLFVCLLNKKTIVLTMIQKKSLVPKGKKGDKLIQKLQAEI